mmetsp:Transcript_4832/g.15313  ORF Transcript_4832/g.15313 Transcript_4832/m.15313 type:complete len:200 (+) Transcript_4832:1265-1864(+)
MTQRSLWRPRPLRKCQTCRAHRCRSISLAPRLMICAFSSTRPCHFTWACSPTMARCLPPFALTAPSPIRSSSPSTGSPSLRSFTRRPPRKPNCTMGSSPAHAAALTASSSRCPPQPQMLPAFQTCRLRLERARGPLLWPLRRHIIVQSVYFYVVHIIIRFVSLYINRANGVASLLARAIFDWPGLQRRHLDEILFFFLS